jgi:hypothetical protein
MGSRRQGALRFRHIQIPLVKSNIPAIVQVMPLFSDKVMSQGNSDKIATRVDPAPIATNRAGRAQQKRVENEVKNVSQPMLLNSD